MSMYLLCLCVREVQYNIKTSHTVKILEHLGAQVNYGQFTLVFTRQNTWPIVIDTIYILSTAHNKDINQQYN